MILCLDVGNSQVFGGVFREDKCFFHFRRNSSSRSSSDEIGVFLRAVLRENNIDPLQISDIAICTVVPDLTHSLRNACLKYFAKDPFILGPGSKTGLKLKVKNPNEVGADRIANCIAAAMQYPNENIIIVDLGTATVFDVLTKDKEFLGGAILPGLGISMETLESRTAKLPLVEIVRPEQVLGRNTVECIQSGIYFSHLGGIKELLSNLAEECFAQEPPRRIATGGFSRLFEGMHIFDEILADLVLEGLFQAWKMKGQ